MTMMFSDVSSLALDFGPSLNPTSIFCVCEQHKLWRAKLMCRAISIALNCFKSNLTNEKYNTYKTGFLFSRLGHAPRLGLGGSKIKFSEHRVQGE